MWIYFLWFLWVCHQKVIHFSNIGLDRSIWVKKEVRSHQALLPLQYLTASWRSWPLIVSIQASPTSSPWTSIRRRSRASSTSRWTTYERLPFCCSTSRRRCDPLFSRVIAVDTPLHMHAEEVKFWLVSAISFRYRFLKWMNFFLIQYLVENQVLLIPKLFFF